MSNVVSDKFFAYCYSINREPMGPVLWKTTLTLTATTGSFEPQNGVSGTVVGVWIDPSTLTASATIKGYSQNDGLTTPDYFLNYTVPNPAIETRDALYKRTRVNGKLQIDVASATSGDSFDLYVWVDPLSATDNAVLDAIALAEAQRARLVPNGTEADQALTVDATVGGVQFAAFHADTTHVEFDVQDAQIRYTLDNSAPTSTNGTILNPYAHRIWPKAKAAAAKLIRTGSTSAVVHASQLKGV